MEGQSGGHEVPADPSLLSAKKTAALDHHFARYLETGGFPGAQALDTQQRRQLLQGYIDVRLLRDVIKRHRVSNVTATRLFSTRTRAAPALDSFSGPQCFSG